MRVLLSTYGSRGDVEPLLGLAVQLRELGAEVVVCAPPDCAARLAALDVQLVPVGAPVRPLVHGATPPSPDNVPRLAAELIAAQFDVLAPVADGCDALVATGLMPVAAGARSVAEKLGIYSVHVSYCPIFVPSPHNRPQPLPGRPIPPDVTDRRELNELDIQNYNTLFGPPLSRHRVAVGLPPVDNVRDHVFGERPLPAELEGFLDAGAPPVYASFGSMRAPEDLARVAIEAIRAQGRRVLLGRGWADLDLIDDRDDCFVAGEVNQQALFGRVAAVVHHGGAGTTTTAARVGAPQVVIPQIADQPYWAGRVADLGVGVAHDGPTPTVESLTAALGTALTPATRARASAVAGTIRTDGAAVAARLLLDAVSGARPALSA